MTQARVETGAPRWVEVPSVGHHAEHRLYGDAFDEAQLHVDALEPHLAIASLETDPDTVSRHARPARPVHVDFEPDATAMAEIQALFPEKRVTPLVWGAGPFFAWIRSATGVSVLDHGQTRRTHLSGSGHRAEIRGPQPEGVELARAVAAAELIHWGRLCGLSVRAVAAGAVMGEIRDSVRLGRRAVWSSTLADALVAVLEDLLRRDRLRVTVASGPVPLRAFDEVREIVLMEWAHRLAGDLALSLPAAHVAGLTPNRVVDLSIDWRDGDRVPLRVVRSARYESIAAESMPELGRRDGGRAAAVLSMAQH